MKEFELITICCNKTFYELEESANDIEDVLKEVNIGKGSYVFPPSSDINIEHLEDMGIYTMTYAKHQNNVIHRLYENLTKEEVLKLFNKLNESENVYINIFESNSKIETKEYFCIDVKEV